LFCGKTDATVKYPWIVPVKELGSEQKGKHAMSMPAAHPFKGKDFVQPEFFGEFKVLASGANTSGGAFRPAPAKLTASDR
jgi:hypothetical protein